MFYIHTLGIGMLSAEPTEAWCRVCPDSKVVQNSSLGCAGLSRDSEPRCFSSDSEQPCCALLAWERNFGE